MKRNLSLLALLCAFVFSLSGQTDELGKVTLSGYIKDADSGETLIGASAYFPSLGTGTTSNEYGFYSITVPIGDYKVDYSYLGFETLTFDISMRENVTRDVEMGEDIAELVEVVVTSEAEDKNISDTEFSVNKLDIRTITKIPALLGEVDVIRSIQLLPGVSTVGEGATGFNVRGGGVDQNLVLLDEAPVFNSSHLFGFFSVFNPDAVKDVKLYKGGIPAKYGGRLSSILDVRMKEGNNKKLAVSGGVGFIFSRLSVEAPIIKDKASFILAGRRSYIDVLSRPFLNDDFAGTALNFYDVTLKTNYKINEKNRLFLSGYLGRDNFRFGENAGFDWGNETATLRWNHLFSDKLFSNFTAYFSNYDYQIKFGSDDVDSFDWDAAIRTYSAKGDISYFANPKNQITFGAQGIIYEFSPGNAVGVSQGERTEFSVDRKYAIEGGIFVQNEQTINKKFSLQYGLRLSYFDYTGEGLAYTFDEIAPGERKVLATVSEPFDQFESIQRYANLEPRASLKYQTSPSSSVKLSYNRMAQYIHLISNSTAASPLDVWLPSTNNIEPQIANQYAAGFFKNFNNNMFETSLEVYYKDFENQVDYIDGADLFVNELIEAELLVGDGRAYGVEVQLEKKKGQFTGWVSYTLARSERLVPSINNDEWYPSRFDQTHNLSTTLFYEFNDRWTVSGNFVFNTGTPATFPTGRIEQQGFVIPEVSNDVRNNVRIPNFHRLDLSATFRGKKYDQKKLKGEWVFAAYNVYNRRNPFSIFFEQDQVRIPNGDPIQTQAIRLSVIGSIIPSVAYNFKF